MRGLYGRSLLHAACSGGDINLVRALVEGYSADISALDEHIKYAASCGSYLLQYGSCNGQHQQIGLGHDGFT